MQKLILAAALACCCGTGALASVPEFGTRESDLVCVALLDLGYQAARQTSPEQVGVLSATAAAWGIFVGRLSKEEQPSTGRDATAVLRKLSVEEMNAYIDVCRAQAVEILGAHSR